MSPNEPEDLDGDWVKRYRQASEIDSAMPSPAAREAILAEGRRVAAARAANPTAHKFDTKQPAANQPRWKLAAAGTMGAALLAAVLMYPHLGAPPTPVVAESASANHSAPAPVHQFDKQIATQEPASDAAVEEVVITGARQARAPDRIAARKSQSASSISADAGASLRGAQDATSQLQGGAQPQRMQTPAAAPPAALSSSATAAQAMRSNLTNDTLLSSVASGDLAHASTLLNEGANPDQMDSMGRTPLLLAVTAHRDDIVGLLLTHHANPNAADQSGQTPLQRARLDGQLNIVRLLERAGAH